MNDPLVSTEALAAALGIPAFQLRLWLRAAGLISRTTGTRGVGLLAALAGILSALRHETAEARAFRAPPLPKLGDALDRQIAALTSDLLRVAESRQGGPAAEEVERLLNRLPGHRRRSMREDRK